MEQHFVIWLSGGPWRPPAAPLALKAVKRANVFGQRCAPVTHTHAFTVAHETGPVSVGVVEFLPSCLISERLTSRNPVCNWVQWGARVSSANSSQTLISRASLAQVGVHYYFSWEFISVSAAVIYFTDASFSLFCHTKDRIDLF